MPAEQKKRGKISTVASPTGAESSVSTTSRNTKRITNVGIGTGDSERHKRTGSIDGDKSNAKKKKTTPAPTTSRLSTAATKTKKK